MADALSFSDTNTAIGLKMRKRCEGPESDLVEAFANLAPKRFWSRNNHIALFFEPLLETGFPDIVICIYDPRHFDEWTSTRPRLQVQDLKVLHHLHLSGPTGVAAASIQLGFDEQLMIQTLENLRDAGLVRPVGKTWRPISIKRAFGIKRLMAIEAKISDWSDVLRQSRTNRWFASETYALSPVQRPSAKVVQRSEQLGVGIYTCGKSEVIEVCPSIRSPLPSCYASWLFNEWIGRRLIDSSTRDLGGHVSA